MRYEYWNGLYHILSENRDKKFPFDCCKEQGRHLNFRFYGILFQIIGSRFIDESRIQAEIYLMGSHAPKIYECLKANREKYESDFGRTLDFGGDFKTGGQIRHIGVDCHGVHIRNKKDWPSQHIWLAENMMKLYEIFGGDIDGDFRSNGIHPVK